MLETEEDGQVKRERERERERRETKTKGAMATAELCAFLPCTSGSSPRLGVFPSSSSSSSSRHKLRFALIPLLFLLHFLGVFVFVLFSSSFIFSFCDYLLFLSLSRLLRENSLVF